MQSRISVTATMLACAALPGIGLAQTAPAPDGGEFSSSTQFLSAVVVTALRHEKENLYVPYSISTVSSDYVDDFGPRTTPDVLNAVNGAFIQKTNLGGGSAFVRGLTGNQSLTLIDGIRLNNATFRYGPNQYLNTIDPFTIDRIEVAKGTGSVQYGTDALGGTVQLLTRNPEFATDQPGWNAKLLGRTMTHGMEQTLRGQAGYSGERFAFIGGVSSKNFGDLIGGNDTGKQSPSGYDEWSADLKTRFLLNPGAELTLAGQFLRQENVPVYHSVQLENYALREMDPQQHALTYARLNLHSDSRWTQDVTLTASWQQSLEGRNARRNGSAIQTREEDKINTLGFSADVFSRLNDYWTANSGIELYHDKVNSAKHDFDTATGVAGPAVRGLYPDDSRYGNYSLYTLSHFNFNQWVIDAGLRFNTFDIRIKDVTLGDVKITPSALVANAAVMYKILDNQSLYLSYSSGYRAPNVDDMGTLGIVDFRYEVPASNLKPEQSQNIEAGYKLQTGRVSLALAAYHMDLSNIITRVATGDQIDGYTVYRKENSQSSYIRGFEAEFSLAATENLNFSGGVAHAYGQNTSADEPMRRIPPFNGRLMGEYRADKWFAAAEFRFAFSQTRLAQGDIDDNRIGPNGTAAWQVVNLYAGYRFSQLHINASLQNIFDEDYRMHGSGINGVGASAWIEASMEF